MEEAASPPLILRKGSAVQVMLEPQKLIRGPGSPDISPESGTFVRVSAEAPISLVPVLLIGVHAKIKATALSQTDRVVNSMIRIAMARRLWKVEVLVMVVLAPGFPCRRWSARKWSCSNTNAENKASKSWMYVKLTQTTMSSTEAVE